MADRRPVRLHPRAQDDAAAAYRWYRERNVVVADMFLVEIDAAIDRIAQFPRRWPRVVGSYRRYLMGRFPFSVVYRELPDCIEVDAIAHHRKRPDYWSRR